MIALLKAETLKLRSTRTTVALLVAAALATVLPDVLILVVAKAHDLQGQDGLRLMTIVGEVLVALVALVFGLIGMTGEYRHGTISYTFLETPNRTLVMVLKLVVYTAGGICLALFAQLVGQLMVAIGFPIRGVPVVWPDAHTLAYTARVVLFTGLITAFGMALGALIRNQIVAIAGTIAWWLVAEPIVTGIVPRVGRWLPFQVFTRIVAEPDTAPTSGNALVHQLSLTTAVVVGLVYIAAVSAAAVLITLRRDVT